MAAELTFTASTTNFSIEHRERSAEAELTSRLHRNGAIRLTPHRQARYPTAQDGPSAKKRQEG
jgi:hypothetical protein